MDPSSIEEISQPRFLYRCALLTSLNLCGILDTECLLLCKLKRYCNLWLFVRILLYILCCKWPVICLACTSFCFDCEISSGHIRGSVAYRINYHCRPVVSVPFFFPPFFLRNSESWRLLLWTSRICLRTGGISYNENTYNLLVNSFFTAQFLWSCFLFWERPRW